MDNSDERRMMYQRHLVTATRPLCVALAVPREHADGTEDVGGFNLANFQYESRALDEDATCKRCLKRTAEANVVLLEDGTYTVSPWEIVGFTEAMAAIPIQGGEIVGNLPSCCERSTVGLEVRGSLSLQQWLKAIKNLDRTEKGYQWHRGDLLLWGEKAFGEDYAQAIDPEEEEQREEDSGETARKCMQVASRFPSGKRLPTLTWSHHLKVTFLDSEAESDYWLYYAAQQKPRLSVRALERAIKKAHQIDEAEPISDLVVLSDENVRAWLEAYIALINEHLKALDALPYPGAPYLRNMLFKHREHALWQLGRTDATDCQVILDAIDETGGLSADDLYLWLENRGFFMSPPQLESTTDYMEETCQILSDSAGKEGKLKEARGSQAEFYVRWYKKREKAPKCKECGAYHREGTDCDDT